jgi:hypothetical protein
MQDVIYTPRNADEHGKQEWTKGKIAGIELVIKWPEQLIEAARETLEMETKDETEE